MTLPKLYKTTKTNAIQYCLISVIKDVFQVEFGQLDTPNPQFQHTTCLPKNVGRANVTTAEQQAEKEAKAYWDKKVKSGYSTDKTAPTTVLLPRKVGKWTPNRFKPGMYSTPKLNGINLICRLIDGKPKFFSRGGDPRPDLPHMTTELLEAFAFLNSKELNGEAYHHGSHLQDIQSAVTKTNELSPKLEFAIFDIADSTDKYSLRNLSLEKLEYALAPDFLYVTTLTGVVCNTIEEIDIHYYQCLEANLEGTVIYSPDNIYVHNQRASDIWKYKPTLDAEYKVIAYETSKHNTPVWILETPTGLTFKANPKGDRIIQQGILAKADDYIGLWATIEYETLSKDGKPLKPIFINFRDCTEDGKPLV